MLKIYPWKPNALQSDQTDEVDNDQIKTLPEYNQHDTNTQKYSNQVLKLHKLMRVIYMWLSYKQNKPIQLHLCMQFIT